MNTLNITVTKPNLYIKYFVKVIIGVYFAIDIQTKNISVEIFVCVSMHAHRSETTRPILLKFYSMTTKRLLTFTTFLVLQNSVVPPGKE